MDRPLCNRPTDPDDPPISNLLVFICFCFTFSYLSITIELSVPLTLAWIIFDEIINIWSFDSLILSNSKSPIIKVTPSIWALPVWGVNAFSDGLEQTLLLSLSVLSKVKNACQDCLQEKKVPQRMTGECQKFHLLRESSLT